MSYFFITTRNISRPRGKPAFFADEPANPSYVISPKNSNTLDPKDRETGSNAEKRWARKVLAAAKQPDGTGDIVISIHGYNNDAEDAFKSHKTLTQNLAKHGLDNAVFVGYSWPSKGSFTNYLEDDSDARETAIHLVKSGLRLFALLSEPDCRIRVHVMAHSMGALVVREALRAASGSKPTREGSWGLTQLLFYGADISSTSLKTEAAAELFGKSQRFTNYFNRHDAVLATSNVKRFLSSPRLGRHGAPAEVLHKMVDVDMSGRWKEIDNNSDLDTIDGARKSHSFYIADDKFAKDVVATIKGNLDRREIPNRDRHPIEEGRLLMV